MERPGGGTVELATVGGITVASHIAPQLQAVLAAAATDGLVLGGSGWRSTRSQIELRRTNGRPDVYTAPPESCAVPTAIPGTSMHEIGEAVDTSPPTAGPSPPGARPSPGSAPTERASGLS